MTKEQILSQIEQTRQQLQKLEAELKAATTTPKYLAGMDDYASLREISDKHPHCVIGMRTAGQYSYNALYLGCARECNWEIVKDREDYWCLIPKDVRKQIDETTN